MGGYDGRDRAVSTVERLHIHGDRWELVADMNKVNVVINGSMMSPSITFCSIFTEYEFSVWFSDFYIV